MPLIAITREVSPSINRCELSFHPRQPIDLAQAISQHNLYQGCLEQLGVRIISLPAECDLPDSVFVEDAALIFDELAIIPIMGAPSRRPETRSIAMAAARFRRVESLKQPAILDGGDVLQVGRRLFVGLTQRTNGEAIIQLTRLLQPHGYAVQAVQIQNVLHLKSACSRLNNSTLLINRTMVDAEAFAGFDLIDVPAKEPAAANVLALDDTIILPQSFPATAVLLEKRGFMVNPVDISELQKAEAGVTCCSLIFDSAS